MAPSFRKVLKDTAVDLRVVFVHKWGNLFRRSKSPPPPPRYSDSVRKEVIEAKQRGLSQNDISNNDQQLIIDTQVNTATPVNISAEQRRETVPELDLAWLVTSPSRSENIPQRNASTPNAVRQPSEAVNPYDAPRDSVPRAVKCQLVIFLDKESHTHFEPFRLEWQDPSQFQVVEKAARRRLVEIYGTDVHVYKKAGRVRLIEYNESGEKEKDSETVETEPHWRERLPIMVARYFGASSFTSKPAPKLVLEVRLEYGRLKVPRIPGATYAATIRGILLENYVENWESKKYWPRKILREVFTDAAIHKILDEDPTLSKAEIYSEPATIQASTRIRGKDEFATLIGLYGVRLLATCIYLQNSLDGLYNLMSNGIDDRSIPLICDAPQSWDLGRWQLFKDNQGHFKPFDFPDLDADIKHKYVKDGIIVPVQFNSKRDRIGKGSFGIVYKVRIHGDHHRLAADKDTLFALKKFRESNQALKDFFKEHKVLEKLAKIPHPNITPYLASWVQDDRFFMLFPLAEHGNLHDFLHNRPIPVLTKDFVLWLLNQMSAIASALDHIHNLGRAGLGPVDSPTSHHQGRPIHTGYHHDLKPKNILVFKDDVFKISDFGTAKIHRIVSGAEENGGTHVTPNLAFGDEIYGAPDFAITRGTSRPYDIFSLGCIFLEILIWTFDGGSLTAFMEERKLFSPENEGNASFWCQIEDRNEWDLKRPVKTKLTDLEYETRNRGVFHQLITLVKEMLQVYPGKRPDAPQVLSKMNALLRQAKIDLSNPDFYKHKASTPLDIYGVPSTVSGPPSRPGSIDARLAAADITPQKLAAQLFLSPESPVSGRRRSTGSMLDKVDTDLDLHGSGSFVESPRQDAVITPVRKHVRQPSITCGNEILHTPETSPMDELLHFPVLPDITKAAISPSMNWFRAEDIEKNRRNSDGSRRSSTA